MDFKKGNVSGYTLDVIRVMRSMLASVMTDNLFSWACVVSREEHYCRFCKMQLPDWKHHLRPPNFRDSSNLAEVIAPTMGVTYQGKVSFLLPSDITYAVTTVSLLQSQL